MTKDKDEAWAMEMIERLHRGTQEAQQRRDKLAAAVDDLADGFTRLGRKPWKSARKSDARSDAQANNVILGERTENIANILRYDSIVNVLSAADQLRGFAVLLRAEASLMGAVSVSRGVFEACLWATALIDPTITTDERLQRALTRRLARLSAGIRSRDLLGGDVADTDRIVNEDESEDDDDEHGTARDPAQDIDDIVAYARDRAWPVKKGRRAWEITALSIDWLTENLERRVGVESYAWTSGSSMSHGEHAADTASWIELSQDIGTAPAWLIRMWSTGAWAGPRLFLATLAAYTGKVSLGREYHAGDAHVLAEIVRLDRTHHRTVAGDSALAEAVKVLARTHQTLIWDRQRAVLRLRNTLREFFPAALEAFPNLTAFDALELLGRAPDPASAAALTRTRITGAFKRARRRDPQTKADALLKLLRAPTLRQPEVVERAYASIVRAQVQTISLLSEQIAAMQQEVAEHFGQHPDAEIYASQPGLGVVLGARVLAEFGDDPNRFADAKARKNYSGQSPVTRASGRKKVVLARYACNRRLTDALHQQAFCALLASPGARAYYDTLRARGKGHHAALRQLANRLVGILHGCLKTGALYDEHTAWAHLIDTAA